MALGRTRRQRLLWRAALAGALAAAGVGAFLALRPSPAPYVPGEAVAGLTRALERDLPAVHPPVRFVDAAVEAGIDFAHFHGVRSHQLPEDMGSGAAWGDYDNDGDPDLYAVNEAGPLTQTAQRVVPQPRGWHLH